MNKRIPIAVAVALAVGAGAWWYTQERNAAENGALTLYGNVDIREVGLSFRVDGRVAEMRFEEGDRVEAGVVLARLDAVPYREALALARAERTAAAARLEKLEAGPRPQEITRARSVVAEREAALVNAQQHLKRQRQLLDSGNTPRQRYDDALTTRNQTEAALATAQAELAELQEGSRVEDIAAARAELAAAEARVDQAQTRLEDTALRAPDGGTILSRVREPGAVVGTGQTVYALSLVEPLWVRAYVAEPDLGRVRPGMPAEIRTDTFPDKVYEGQVGFISPVAEFTPKTVETPDLRTDLVFRLRVVVPHPDEGLRQGMPVTVRLIEDRAADTDGAAAPGAEQ